MSKKTPKSKQEALRQLGVLNTSVERVCDKLFLESEFFDPCDLVQVKYEMLRRVRLDGWSVSRAAHEHGFSRTVFYQALASYEARGLPGLIPNRPGPRHAHKLTDSVLEFIEAQLQADESLRAVALAELVRRQLGLSVHPRSIERALARQRKKGL